MLSTASWDELVDRFGWTPRRRQLLDGLAEAIELLAAAGCTRIWWNGSFVTAKDEPADWSCRFEPPVLLSCPSQSVIVRDKPLASRPPPWPDPQRLCCGAAAIDPATGRLPEGEHAASWDELVDRFGWTQRRRQLLD